MLKRVHQVLNARGGCRPESSFLVRDDDLEFPKVEKDGGCAAHNATRIARAEFGVEKTHVPKWDVVRLTHLQARSLVRFQLPIVINGQPREALPRKQSG